MSPEPQNVKECFHGSSQIVGKCHILCDFFWNISRWSAKTPKYQGSLNSPSLLTFKISLSDLQWILIVSRWVAKTPLVLGRFSRSSAKLQNFQINSTDYINACACLLKKARKGTFFKYCVYQCVSRSSKLNNSNKSWKTVWRVQVKLPELKLSV